MTILEDGEGRLGVGRAGGGAGRRLAGAVLVSLAVLAVGGVGLDGGGAVGAEGQGVSLDPGAGPEVSFATFLGGSDATIVHDVVVDGAGSLYVTGQTGAADFPATDGAFDTQCGTDGACDAGAVNGNEPQPDGFVAKFLSGGDLVWAIYLGGSRRDIGWGVAVRAGCEQSCEVVVVGETESRDFPTTADAFRSGTSGDAGGEGFVGVVDPSGQSLRFGSYLGGSVPGLSKVARDTARAVAVDAEGKVYVGGTTQSVDFATSLDPGGERTARFENCLGPCDRWGFVLKLDVAGSVKLGYLALVSGPFAADAGQGFAGLDMKVDPKGRVVLAGQALTGLPTTGDTFVSTPEGFVVWLHEGGDELLYADYLLGEDVGPVQGVAVTDGGVVHAVGAVDGFRGGGGFIAKLNMAAEQGSGVVVFARRIEGSEAGNGVAVSPTCSAACGSVVVGRGVRDEFDHAGGPGLADAGGGEDGFVAWVGPNGQMLRSVLLGGAGADGATGVAAGLDGSLVVAGVTGSEDFPTVRAAQDAYRADPFDGQAGFVARLSPVAAGAPVISGLVPDSGPVSGGSRVEITGRRLEDAQQVLFGEVPAGSFEVVSDTRIEVVSPPGARGHVPVTVVDSGGLSSPLNPFPRFEYAQGAWQPVEGLSTPRWGHTATMLADGRIMVAGGCTDYVVGAQLGCEQVTGSVEVFDLDDSAWSPGPGLASCNDDLSCEARTFHSASLLEDGRVLLVGGCVDAAVENPCLGLYGQSNAVSTASSQVLEPGSGGQEGTWTVGPALKQDGSEVPSRFHRAVRLDTGELLLVGATEKVEPLAVVFVPGAGGDQGSWQDAARPPGGEGIYRDHPVVKLGDGRVIVVRVEGPGENGGGIYEREAGWEALAGAPVVRTSLREAAELGDGRVLVPGGSDTNITGGDGGGTVQTGPTVRDVFAYDPVGRSWSAVASMVDRRLGHTVTALPDGRILVAGGYYHMHSDAAHRGAELYDPQADEWVSAGKMGVARRSHEAVVVSSDPEGFGADPAVCGNLCGRVLVVGGVDSQTGRLAGAELYTPPPTVSLVSPARAEAGQTVAIEGLGLNHGLEEVSFGDQVLACPSNECQPDPADPYHRLEVTVPPVGDEVSVEVSVVTEGGRAVAPGKFSYTGLPGRVSDLAARRVEDTAVEVSFGAAGSVGGAAPPASEYLIRRSQAPIDSEEAFDQAAVVACGGRSVCQLEPAEVGERLSVTVGGLAEDATYWFAVRARNQAGQVGPFAQVQASTGADGVAPGRVSDLAGRVVDATTVGLTWSAVASDGESGPVVGGYILKESTSGPITGEHSFAAASTLRCAPESEVCQFGPSEVGQDLSVTIKGRRPSTTYFYAVRAMDAAGNVGPVSNGVEVSTPAGRPGLEGVVRLSGADRIATAVAASRDAFPTRGSAQEVVVARADLYPDALSGVALAARVGGPLLLTPPQELDGRVAQEIDRVVDDGAAVYLLGGRKAISAAVEEALVQAGYQVLRLAGPTRYATAVRIAEELGEVQAVLVATGDDFADAATAGAAAAHIGGVVVLSAGGQLPSATAEYLASRQGVGRWAVGGPAAQAVPDAKPLVGATRFETAVAVADAFFAGTQVVGVATGLKFADAIAGGAHLARLEGPMLLSGPNQLHPAVGRWLARQTGVAGAVIYGGPAALGKAVEEDLHQRVGKG